jgi:hypothetical protein
MIGLMRPRRPHLGGICAAIHCLPRGGAHTCSKPFQACFQSMAGYGITLSAPSEPCR